MGNSGIPRARRSTSPRTLNRWVQTVTVGTPRRSSSAESWILHDVQDPQSPRPTIATWAEVVNSSMTSCLAAIDAEGLRWWTALLISYFWRSNSSNRAKRMSPLGLLFQRKPTDLPRRSGGRGAMVCRNSRGGAVGSKTKMEPVAVAVIISLQSFRLAGTIYNWNTIGRGYSVGQALSRAGSRGATWRPAASLSMLGFSQSSLFQAVDSGTVEGLCLAPHDSHLAGSNCPRND